MTHKRAPSKIYPKVSTLPRQRTEADHYLDMYKLTVEKKRIQQELENMNQRRQRLLARLADIEQQTEGLGDRAEGSPRPASAPATPKQSPLRASHSIPTSAVYLPDRANPSPPQDYSTVVLDY
ncbi:gas vesicle protein [Nodosilinea sp. P-1105]|uniref:gas vesicle protein n=1 Tax=Nodosilinea sp. P-1105 TaxID=2546229 RepID=UPI00146AEACF|nr:gas vesicle protein [Nodosilinea sp. P-1105]NMF85320.1 gas vesicle protein [Nodosilinea sp. P-1105]